MFFSFVESSEEQGSVLLLLCSGSFDIRSRKRCDRRERMKRGSCMKGRDDQDLQGALMKYRPNCEETNTRNLTQRRDSLPADSDEVLGD